MKHSMKRSMKRWMVLPLAVCMTALLAVGAQAAGVTLRAYTPFADVDFAAQSYMDMITAWEGETGNVVEDYSGSLDEMWMGQLREALAAGEADVVVLPVGSGLTVSELVTAGELLEAADCGVKKFASMKEADGSILLSPVRLYWEAVYVNTDVLARYGLPVPETFEQMLTVCAVLSQNGVTPIANALCEWPEIALDCAALAGADEEAYGQQASLAGAQDYLMILTQVGAFGSDPWNAADDAMEQAFLSGEAAMRIDADTLAQMVGSDRLDSVVAMPLPAKDGAARTKIVGTPAFGVAISRACWQDAARREAAVSFVTKMLSGEGMKALCAPVGGALGESIAQLTANAQDCTGILYDMNPDTFDAWAESVVAGLMGL